MHPSSTSKASSNDVKQKVETMAQYLKTMSERQLSENLRKRYDESEQISVGDVSSDEGVDKTVTIGALEPAAIDPVTIYTQDSDGDTLLHVAIILRRPACAVSFISKAPTHEWLSFKNLLFQTPLHLAAIGNQPEVVRTLVVAGADITSQDKDGNAALHIACRDGNLNVLMSLFQPVLYNETRNIRYKIPERDIPQDLSIRNFDGLTCLHLAAIHGHSNIVEHLITNGPEIINEQEGKSGRTVLHNACQNGDINLVTSLLRHTSCDINARAFDGYTPFDLARAKRYDHICTVLAAAGAGNNENCS